MAKKFKVMASNAKEPDGKCIPKSMRKSVESACGKKKAVKASYDDAKIITDEFLTKVNNPYLENQYQKNDFEVYLIDGDTLDFRYCKTRKAKELATKLAKKFYPEYDVLDLTKLGAAKNSYTKKSVKSSKSVKKFGIKASKTAKKRVAAAKGYWADDINAESYRKILKALDDYLIANYDGKTIGDVEIGVSELRNIKDGKGSKIEVEFYCPDYEKDTKLEIISAPDLRSKFLCRVSVDPFKFDEELEIPQSGSKQIVVDKINEIANRLSGSAVESSCKTKKTVKASAAAKKRKAQQRIMAAESNGLERAKQYIVDAYNNENWDSEDMTVDEYFKNEDLHKVGLVYTTLGDNDEYDYQISVDLIDPKVIVEIDGELVYEDSYSGIDALADDLADFNWDDWYSYYIHKLPKEYDDIFSSIKKSVNVKITASDNYYDEDIVFYFNGKKQFEGSIFDLAGNVEILCHDPKVMQVFQDYCNQFGDPFDFDGTPRDTALVFTKLVMFEAEEANEPSDFYIEYSDYRKPGSFEIYYANEGIYSAKSIHAYIDEYPNWVYDWSESKTEKNKQLYDSKLNEWYDKAESMYPNFYQLKGDDRKNAISDVNKAVGFTMDDVFTSIDIQCSDADGIADEWEDIREIANQDSYEYDGYEDSDMLEYVDSFLQDTSSGAWLSTDHVVYNGPDDWEVSAGLSPEAVESDFWFFLDDVDHELYEEMLEAEIANPLDEDPINYTYNQNAINGNEFYIQLYPNNNQVSAPQIDFDEEYLTPEWLDRLVEIRKQYEESRIAAYTEFQNGLGGFLANDITASTDIKAANSLNLNAKPNYTDWMLRGYKFDGEDVTTLRIDFQDDVKQAVMDMFADPDIETVDLYKIPTEQETTGVFEDEEYFKTFTREDINSSVDIFWKFFPIK